jgi:hypothetical protein
MAQRTYVHVTVLVALVAFLPLFYYLAVVGGLLPYAAILLIAMRNIGDSSILLFSAVHLFIYGVALYWLADFIAQIIIKVAKGHAWLVTLVVLVLLSALGSLPIFGIAHGQIHWTNAYALYASKSLR